MQRTIDRLPKCSNVWIEGATLPEDYQGCVQGSTTIVPALIYKCLNRTRLTMIEKPAAFARLGGTIEFGGANAFSAEYADCVGEDPPAL